MKKVISICVLLCFLLCGCLDYAMKESEDVLNKVDEAERRSKSKSVEVQEQDSSDTKETEDEKVGDAVTQQSEEERVNSEKISLEEDNKTNSWWKLGEKFGSPYSSEKYLPEMYKGVDLFALSQGRGYDSIDYDETDFFKTNFRDFYLYKEYNDKFNEVANNASDLQEINYDEFIVDKLRNIDLFKDQSIKPHSFKEGVTKLGNTAVHTFKFSSLEQDGLWSYVDLFSFSNEKGLPYRYLVICSAMYYKGRISEEGVQYMDSFVSALVSGKDGALTESVEFEDRTLVPLVENWFSNGSDSFYEFAVEYKDNQYQELIYVFMKELQDAARFSFTSLEDLLSTLLKSKN